MCDTVVVLADDAVRFAKNSDRDPNEAQLLDWQPRGFHAAGSPLRCTWIDIPQVAETNSVLLGRPFWMWGAEMGANDHGVVIGNEAVWTDQPLADLGLTGMDLLRLALERAVDRHGAVGVIVELLERHGQGGGCGLEKPGFNYHNSFLVADAGGATVVETAGSLWETEEVRAGSTRSISNALTIPAFAAAHADRMRGRVACAATRRRATETSGAATIADLAALLRLHHGGAPMPDWTLSGGAVSSPCMHAGGLIASSQTTNSWLSELGAGAPRHWATGTAAPCTGLFKPVEVAQPVDVGADPTDQADDQADDASLWWRHEVLHRRVMADPAALLARYRDERDRLERANLSGDVGSAAAFGAGDEALGRWIHDVLDAANRDRRPLSIRRYWSVRDKRARLGAAVGGAARG